MKSSKRANNRELWWSRMQRFRASGLSVTRSCEQERVSQPSFYQWRKRLADVTVGSSAPTFVPVRVTQSTLIEIHLPNGARVCVPPGDREALRVAIEVAGQWSNDRHGESDVC